MLMLGRITRPAFEISNVSILIHNYLKYSRNSRADNRLDMKN